MSNDSALTELTYSVRCGDPRLVGEMLTTPQALLRGHFELLSGLHSDHFVAFSRIADNPSWLDRIADWLMPNVAPMLPDALLAPSTAGVGLAWALARRLGIPLHLARLDASGRADGIIGAPRLSRQRILLINDIVTTGTGLHALHDVAKGASSVPVGAAWFLSRTPNAPKMPEGLSASWIVDIALPAWAADQCSLCTDQIPVELGLDLN